VAGFRNRRERFSAATGWNGPGYGGIPSRHDAAEIAVYCRLKHHRIRTEHAVLLLQLVHQPIDAALTATPQLCLHHPRDLAVGPAAHQTFDDDLLRLGRTDPRHGGFSRDGRYSCLQRLAK